jgi:hypothetical protein
VIIEGSSILQVGIMANVTMGERGKKKVNLLYNVKIIELLFHQIFGKKRKENPKGIKN